MVLYVAHKTVAMLCLHYGRIVKITNRTVVISAYHDEVMMQTGAAVVVALEVEASGDDVTGDPPLVMPCQRPSLY